MKKKERETTLPSKYRNIDMYADGFETKFFFHLPFLLSIAKKETK